MKNIQADMGNANISIATFMVLGFVLIYSHVSRIYLSEDIGTHLELIHTPGRPFRTSLSTSACPFITKKTLQPVQNQPYILYGQFDLDVNLTQPLKVFEIHGPQTVIDFACAHIYRRAFYHRLIDCFVPQICALQYASMSRASTSVLVPLYLLEIYEYFLEVSQNRTLLAYADKEKPPYGLKILSKGHIDLIFPNFTAEIDEHQEGLAGLRELILDRNPRIAQKPMHIVIIHRSCSHTRCFPDVTTIFNRFTKELNMPGVLYYGNESFKETVEIFANARVVVGYHGAGFANAVFSPWGTIVLEYTTFYDMNGTRLWRTNGKIAQIHGGLAWLRHGIDVDRLTDLDTLANTHDTDHFIKDLKYVQLTGATMYNSIERVKHELADANQG